ncbi:MAG TPA: FkbM family methyltransferase [Vicinamibacterales bacterium]|nr:FkbM family methyltransferase [Vicinamibacterales bacterium]
MSARKGQLWKWRRRVAYRLLATPNKTDTDDDLAPVRLDFPGTDIWLRATSMPERRWRAKSCAKEPFTVQWLEDYVRKGDVLYDVGANVGTFSLIAALGRKASVVAFEPGYANFARLCENILLNECTAAIVPVPLPLSDAPGLLPFKYRSLEPGQSRHALGEAPYVPRRGSSSTYVQPVCATTLDRAVADFQFQAPHHMKIDVDGSELRVLRGAAAVLRGEQLRSILIETDAGEWDRLAAELTGAGFRLQARYERPGKDDAPAYALWIR